jgi:hypothetical protein
MKIEKITRKQWAVAFLILSIPLVWWGYVNFMYKGSNSAVMAMAISLCLTSGICCVVGGIYMLFTKEKGRGEGLLASQTKVKDSPIKKEIINQPTKKVNEMAKVKATKDTHVADAVKEFREIGQSMKDGATRRANIRARLKEMGIAIDEDGKIDV